MKAEFIKRQYTSMEQADFLEGIGLPLNTADMYYFEHSAIYNIECPKIVAPQVFSPDEMEIPFKKRRPYFIYPCWSVGQLIWISKFCNLDERIFRYRDSEIRIPIDKLMDIFNDCDFDFLEIEDEKEEEEKEDEV